jgi:hypothetical protein
MRYATHPHPAGSLVLDTWTGALTLVRNDGQLVELRGACSPAELVWQSVPSRVALPLETSPGALPAPMVMPPSLPTSPGVVSAPIVVSASLPTSADALDREVVATFPYPIALAWQNFLLEVDARIRCRLLVDAFTQALKYAALVAASDYLRAQQVDDPSVNETLARDLQRPLISAWDKLLERVFPAMRDAKVKLFMEELSTAYDRLQRRCTEKVSVPVQVEDQHGQSVTKISQLSILQALIRFRNLLAHGVSLSPERARQELARYLPPMRTLLAELRFLSRYSLLHRAASSPNSVARMMGATPSFEIERLEPIQGELDSPLLLRSEVSHEVLQLFVFFDVGGEEPTLPGIGGDVLLWEGKTHHSVLYLSASGEQVEKRSRLAQWDALLARKRVSVKVLTRENLTLDALRLAASRVSDRALDTLVASGKFLREVVVDRPDLEQLIRQAELSDTRGMLVGGESGIGKSTLLAQLVERWRAAGDVVLFYRGSALEDAQLGQRVMRDLGLRDLYFEDFLEAASTCFTSASTEGAGPRLRLVIDAVNEYSDPGALLRAIDTLVEQLSSYGFARMLVSVRTSTWERLAPADRVGARPGARWFMAEERSSTETLLPLERRLTAPVRESTHRGPDEAHGPGAIMPMAGVPAAAIGRSESTKKRSVLALLLPLADDAQVGRLYELYRAYRRRDEADAEDAGVASFRPTTSYDELDASGATRKLIHAPLMMRLVLEAYNRRALPSHVTTDEAMGFYLRQVVAEQDSDTPRRERVEMLRALVKQLDERGSDEIPRDALYELPGLRRLVRADRDRSTTR